MLKELIKVANSLDDKGFHKEADALDEIINKISSKELKPGKSAKQRRLKSAAEELSSTLEALKEKYYVDYHGDGYGAYWDGPMEDLGPAAMEVLDAVTDLEETYHHPGYEYEGPWAHWAHAPTINEEEERARKQKKDREEELGFSPDNILPDEDLSIISKRDLINREREKPESFDL
jgi:hypothetical protein